MINDLPDFTKASVLIIGDVMLDRYWYGQASRISPEAPVPIVHVNRTVELPGGAGNVALNVRSVGGNSILMGITGDDAEANSLERKLLNKGILTVLQRETTLPTIMKLRVMSHHQQLIRCDFENIISPQYSHSLNQEYQSALSSVGAVIVSDYGKGTIADPGLLIRLAREKNIPILIDPKGSDYRKYKGATLLTPNRKEFEAVVGQCHTEEELISRGHQLRSSLDLNALLITRGEQGMTLLQEDKDPLHLPAAAREVFDVTGAGDTVIALLATALASGAEMEEATQIANLAASIVVTKMGAATVSAAELSTAMNHSQSASIITEDILLQRLKEAKRLGKKIVMTNGCFDVLHRGHITYLKQAKKLGHHLIVAVNDDASVKRLKGQKRPMNKLADRMALLAELECVDWVIPFSEDTPYRLIELLVPDILVKGGDYSPHEVVGGDIVTANGGKVVIIDFVAGYSTTSLFESIAEEMA